MKLSTGFLVTVALIVTAFTSSYVTTKLHERTRLALEQSATALAKSSYVYGCIQGLEVFGVEVNRAGSCVAMMQAQQDILKVQLDVFRGTIKLSR